MMISVSLMRCLAALVFLSLTRDASAQDYARLAAKMVSSLKLQSSERVLLRSDPQCFSGIVAPLQKQIRAAGAKSVESLPVTKPFSAATLDAIDVVVQLPRCASAPPVPDDERTALVAWLARGGARRELHFHWSEGTRRPDGLAAEHTPELDRLYEDALDIDYPALEAAQNRAIEILRLGAARVNTPAGTDLFFRVGVRPFNKQNGDAAGTRAAAARVRVDREIELPAGVLRVAPVEESVFGQIVIPEARFGADIARGIVIQLDNGKITRIRAKEGQDIVERALAAGGDAAYRFREFALGFNPKLVRASGGAIPYYGYGSGVVRLSLGDNEELGGDVRGKFARWFFFPDATVHVDFRYLVRDGKLVLGN